MQSAPDASGSTSDSTSTPNENSSLRRFSIGAAGEMTISRNGNASTLRLIDTLLSNPIVRELAAPLTSPNSPDAPMAPSVIDTSGNRLEVPSTPRGGTPPEIIEDEDTNPPPSFQSMAPLGLQPIESTEGDLQSIEFTEDELTRANQPDSTSDSDDESYSSMPPLEAIDQSSQQTPSGSGPNQRVLEDFARRVMTRGNTIHSESRMPLNTEMWERFMQSTPSQLVSMVTALNDQLNQDPLADLPDLPLSTPESSDSDSESDSEAPTDVIVEQDNRAPRRRVARYHDLL